MRVAPTLGRRRQRACDRARSDRCRPEPRARRRLRPREKDVLLFASLGHDVLAAGSTSCAEPVDRRGTPPAATRSAAAL